MNRTPFVFFLGLLSMLAFSSLACAQVACPTGWIPYSATSCGPAADSQPSPQANGPSIVWESRWGAIATDGDKGVLGTATGEASQRRAESTAMAECQAKGGATCKLQISYANACGVMVVGSSGFSTAYAGTKEEAVQKSMAVCKSDGDTTCHVYYTDCSLPKRVR